MRFQRRRRSRVPTAPDTDRTDALLAGIALHGQSRIHARGKHVLAQLFQAGRFSEASQSDLSQVSGLTVRETRRFIQPGSADDINGQRARREAVLAEACMVECRFQSGKGCESKLELQGDMDGTLGAINGNWSCVAPMEVAVAVRIDQSPFPPAIFRCAPEAIWLSCDRRTSGR